jgi:AraC-like DNA-binding protein
MSRLYNEQYGAVAPQKLVLQNFQALINQHYRELHSAAAYAGLLHLTPDHLNDVIKQQSGKTVLMHIHERIMVEAKRSLLHTEFSVKEIADQLGFADAAYFNRFFKRMLGVTPVLYREQIREMYR